MNVDTANDADHERGQHQRDFSDYFQREWTARFKDSVAAACEAKSFRVELSLEDLRKSDDTGIALADYLLERPVDGIRAVQDALNETTAALMQKSKVSEQRPLTVSVVGAFELSALSPRELQAEHLGKLVGVEGIVTGVGAVRPKLKTAVQYCPNTERYSTSHYRDGLSVYGPPTSFALPKRDNDENNLEMEFGDSTYEDFQRVTIQEMPERAPMGQLPRSMEVAMERDLVDSAKCGDRVRIVGIFRAVAEAGRFKSVVIANNVSLCSQTDDSEKFGQEDLEEIRNLAKSEDVFERVSRSIAPSIYGHAYIKKALLLMLLGGVEKNLDNGKGTHLRGDINLLMVGDPSTAKSQLLRFVLGLSPVSVSTTGRGSSGVGLTAAVTTDKDTGERRLEAGAMVLADRGVVCIDEFDKMSDMDRVAIHEVMEQQTVTIAKAGIHASLNARCSVVAAANPIYGNYDRELSPQRNVGLPDSLLSRFDLLFIVLDDLSPQHDRNISEHVLRMHRYQRPGREGVPLGLGEVDFSAAMQAETSRESDRARSTVFEKFNPLLHGGFAQAAAEEGETETPQLLSVQFLRKYIAYAKKRFKPVLTDDAEAFISDAYSALRQERRTKTLPVTARQLETLIRLATAHAKLRLSKEVELVDCEAAKEVMMFALYHDTDLQELRAAEKRGRNRAAADDDSDDSSSDSSSDDDGDEASNNNEKSRKRPKRSRSSSKVVEFYQMGENYLQSERFSTVSKCFVVHFNSMADDLEQVEGLDPARIDLLAQVREEIPDVSDAEFDAVMTKFESENKIQLWEHDGVRYIARV